MMRSGVIWFLMFAIASCAAHSPPPSDRLERAEVDEDLRVLPEDYFSSQAKCFKVWGDLVSEWRKNGGGVRDSISATRAQIASDQQSRFAALVRRAWTSQSPRQGKFINELGRWPIGIEESRRVAASVVFSAEDGIPAECQALDLLQSFLWDEVRLIQEGELSARKLRETPAYMKWESPEAQQWVAYWLLVRLN